MHNWEAYLAIGTILVSIGVAWGISKVSVERLWQEQRDIKTEMKTMQTSETLCQVHTNTQIGEIKSNIAVNEERFVEILRRLSRIENKLDGNKSDFKLS